MNADSTLLTPQVFASGFAALAVLSLIVNLAILGVFVWLALQCVRAVEKFSETAEKFYKHVKREEWRP